MYEVVENVLLALLAGWALMVVFFAWVGWVNWNRPPFADDEGIGVAREGIGGA